MVWIVDIFIGTSATVSDIAVTEGWAEDLAKYEVEKIKFRFRTLYYAIPSILLLSLTIMAIRQKNERLFYWTFLIGLTLFQIIPVLGLINNDEREPSFIKPILLTFFTFFLMGQLFSAFRLVKFRNSGKLK